MGTSVRKNLYWNTLLRIPVRIICFFISIMVARLLEPSDYGILAITMMGIGYANLITNFGLNEAVIQRTITCKKTINSIFTVDLVISMILAMIFVAAAGMIAGFFHELRCQAVIRVMSLVFIITSFYGIPHALLRRDNNFKMLSVLEMAKSMSTSILTLLLAFSHFGYWALAYGQLVPLLIFTLIICVKTKWRPAISLQFNLLKPVLHFGSWNFLKSQTTFLVSEVENIIVGRMLGSYSLGVYDKAKSIARVPYDSIILNINSVMFSSFSNHKYDNEILKSHFSMSISLCCIISFPIYLGLIIIAPYFVTVLLGSKWIAMIIPFQIILVGYLFKSFGGLITSFNVGIGKYKEQTILLFFSGLVLVFLSFILVRYGIIGVSFGFFVYSVLEFFICIRLSLLSLHMKWRTLSLCMLTAAWSSAVMFAILTFLVKTILHQKNMTNLFCLVIVGFLLYAICVALDKTRYSVEIKRKIYQDIKSLTISNS